MTDMTSRPLSWLHIDSPLWWMLIVFSSWRVGKLSKKVPINNSEHWEDTIISWSKNNLATTLNSTWAEQYRLWEVRNNDFLRPSYMNLWMIIVCYKIKDNEKVEQRSLQAKCWRRIVELQAGVGIKEDALQIRTLERATEGTDQGFNRKTCWYSS
jgi:hypothetical protein